MAKFSEERMEQAIIELLGQQGFDHVFGDTITRLPSYTLSQIKWMITCKNVVEGNCS